MAAGEMQINNDTPHLKANPGDIEIPNRVFVKGFPRETSEDDLKVFFEAYGIVRESKILKDKSGISKGYAFITFDSQDVAEKVKDLQAVQYGSKDLALGPARIRKKRSGFRARLEPAWGSGYGPVYGVGGIQAPLYATQAPDGGVWYYSSAPQALPMLQSQVPTPGQNYWQPQYPSQVQASSSLYQVPTSNIPQNSQAPYLVNNLTWNDVVRLVRKQGGTPVVPVTPPESPDFGNGNSPLQCVPVYENAYVGDEVSLTNAQEAQNVVLIEARDPKLKRVIMRRDGTKHAVVQGQYTTTATSQGMGHPQVGLAE